MIQPDDFFAALADPTRRRILALLQAEDERCVESGRCQGRARVPLPPRRLPHEAGLGEDAYDDELGL